MTPLAPVALAAARRAAAERFTTIALGHLPPGVTLHYRRNLTGRAFFADRRIETPRPVTRRALHIFLHEVAHFELHAPGRAHAKAKRWVQEAQAEQWAFSTMRAHGIAVPRQSLERAKAYVARRFRMAHRNGLNHITPDELAAARWAGIDIAAYVKRPSHAIKIARKP